MQRAVKQVNLAHTHAQINLSPHTLESANDRYYYIKLVNPLLFNCQILLDYPQS